MNKMHNLLPTVTSFQTETAQYVDLKLKELVKSSWPKDKISDGMLLSMYFSPGCAGSEIRDLENANQIAEHPAEDAAYAVAAAQGSEQGSDQVGLKYPVRTRILLTVPIHFKLFQIRLQASTIFRTDCPTCNERGQLSPTD
ncbi:hypothetical protein BGZ88_004521 [Linnemannia elongata]|nr:hypothetical protein BGZ88_004521 [Linnemannia elongata]